MAEQIYAGAKRGKSVVGFVPAKFMTRDGNDRTERNIANPNNYLIVSANHDANHDEQKARGCAADITRKLNTVDTGGEDVGLAGPNEALIAMVQALRRGGTQDLQRHPQP